MKRNIIEIDENVCNGCGNCVPNCKEGALQIIDGKARLVSDLFCDGLGACIGECPVGAIKVIEREAEPYDEVKVMEHIIPQGENTIKAHLKHLKEHGANEFYATAVKVLKDKNITLVEDAPPVKPLACGCPGTLARKLERTAQTPAAAGGPVTSELNQWPIQLHLINPEAPYFKNADLLVSADCVPFAFGDFHRKLLHGKMVVTFCPKLDNSADVYVEKLAHLFAVNDIRSVTVARMEVPCCGGTYAIVKKALELAGKDMEIRTVIIGIDGDLKF